MTVQTLRATLTFGEERLDVTTLNVIERLSSCTRAAVRVRLPVGEKAYDRVGAPCLLELVTAAGEMRSWPLEVFVVSFLEEQRGASMYELELGPRLRRLDLGRNTRRFRDLDAIAIAKKVLEEIGCAPDVRVNDAPAPRPYVVQYRETSLAFLERLLEREGIFYRFLDDGTLVLEDTSTAADVVPYAGSIPMVDRSSNVVGPGVRELDEVARVRSGAVAVNDYDWKNPRLELLRRAAAEREHDLELYLPYAGYRTPAEGERLAALRLRSERSLASEVRGQGHLPLFTPGLKFTLEGAGASSGEYFLFEVTHDLVMEGAGAELAGAELAGQPAEKGRYETSFAALTLSTRFNSSNDRPRPVVRGTHEVIVTGPPGEAAHTDRHGRFKGRFHWDLEAEGTDKDSRWMRLMQNFNSGYQVARTDWELPVAYVDGDPERPVGVGRVHNELHPPAYKPNERTGTTTLKSRTRPGGAGSNEIRLDDASGAMQFYIHAQHVMGTEVGVDQVEVIAESDSERAMSKARVVGGSHSLSIGGTRTIQAGAGILETVGGARTESIGGSESIVAIGSVSEHASGPLNEKVGGSRRTNAGGGLSRTAREKLTRTVAGDYTVTAAANISMASNGTLAETSGPRTITSGGTIAVSVTGTHDEKVEGNLTEVAGGTMGWSTHETELNVAGNARLAAGPTLQIKAKEISVTAALAIDLRTPQLRILLEPEQVTIVVP